MMKIVISAVIVSLLTLSITSCKLSEEAIKPEVTPSKIGVSLDVFADKKTTGVRASFEKLLKPDSIQIEFNGKKLTNGEHRDGRIEYRANFEGYDKTSQFLITMPDGKQYKFELEVEPIDFQVEEPFTIHRLKATEIKMSKPYTGQYPPTLAIFDNYIGGFKTEPDFNQNKTAIMIRKPDRERMSVGDAKIVFHNVETKKIDNELFDVWMDVSYKSELNLKVLK